MKVLRGIARRAKKAVSPRYWIGVAASKTAKDDASRVLDMLRLIRSGERVDTEAWQKERLSRILRYAYENCPYYTELFDNAGINPDAPDDFRRIPFLDKATAKRRTVDITSGKLRWINHHTKKTGGSTTDPLCFPMAETTDEMDGAHYTFTYECMGYTPGDHILAFSGADLPGEMVEQGILWLDSPNHKDLPYGRHYFSAFWVTEETLPKLVDHVLKDRPAILRGFPSLIDKFSIYIIKNRIELPFEVKGVQFTSENISQAQIRNAETAFRAHVYLQYGHSEMGIFAYTLDNTYVYRCSPFFGITEVLNEDGTHVGVGETGEVVVTGFHNFAFPFIRYRTSDLATYGGVDNGFVLLEAMQGREHDYFLGADGRRVSIMTIPELDAFQRMVRWQAIQNEPGRVVLKVVKAPDYTDKDERELIECMRSHCDVESRIEYVESIPLTQRGKLRQLVQNIDLSDVEREP